MLAVHTNQLVGTELQGRDCHTARRQWQDDLDSTPAKDVDLAWSILTVAGTYGKQGLNGIICKSRDLRVDAIAEDIIDGEQIRSQAR